MKMLMGTFVLAALAGQDPAPAKDEVAELTKELSVAWTALVDLCREGKKDELQKAIAAMELSRAELTQLFGEEKAAKVHEAYRDTWEKRVLAEAADDLVKRYEASKWTEVEAVCLNTREDRDLTDEDRALLGSLVNRDTTRVFNVRLKAKGLKNPLLLRSFVRTASGWKMALRLGRPLGGGK